MSLSSWLHNWKRSLDRRSALHQTQRPRPASHRWIIPCLEWLEDRLAPATLTVNSVADNTTDTSALNLREAITLVNNAGDPTSLGQSGMPAGWQSQISGGFGSNDTIQFDPSLSGQTITQGSSLPALTSSVAIDGPGASNLAISGAGQYQVFHASGGVTVSLSGLTIENGAGRGGLTTVLGDAGTTLDFTGDSLDTSASLTADTAIFGGSNSVAGSYQASSGTTIYSGTTTFSGTVSSLGANVDLYFNGGRSTLDLSAASLPAGGLTVSNLNLQGGILNAAGAVTVTEGFASLNSILLGSGTLTLASGSTGSVNGNFTAAGSVVNDGILSLVNSDVELAAGQTFINQGALVATLGGGSTVNAAFNNQATGTVHVQGNGLTFTGSVQATGTPGTTTFLADPGTSLSFGGPTNLDSSTSIDGDSVGFYGQATVAGSYQAASTNVIVPGDVLFSGPVLGVGALTVNRGDAIFSPATGDPVTLTLDSLDFLGNGSLGGTDNLQITGLFTWTSGWLSGPTGSTLDALGGISGGNGSSGPLYLFGRTLNNYGTANIDEMTLWNGAVIHNLAGAAFNFQGGGIADGGINADYNGGVFGSGSSGAFYNDGTVTQSGSGAASISSAFTNSGSVTVQSGTLSFTDGYLQTAGSTTLAGGSLAGELNIQGGTLTGAGTVYGDVTNGGQVTPGGSDVAGVLAITGNYTQTSSGVLAVDVGGTTAGTQYDQLQVGGNASLNGTLSLNLTIGVADLCGDSFRVLTFGSRSGDFTNEQSLTLANGLVINPVYDATGLNLVVPEVATNVTVTASADPSLLNQSVTFTATVTPSLSGIETPTGTVQFQIDGANIGSPVALVNGSASFSTSSLAVGNHTITAIYSGDGDCLLANTGSLSQAVHYKFNGFLPPLSNSLAFAVNRSIPIQFQLSDYNGKAITSLSAVTSLQIQALDAHGNPVDAAFPPASTNNQGLQYSGGQYQFNWQTKGLAAGSYEIVLTLADGTTYTKTIQLTSNGSGSNAQATDGSDVADGSTAGQLLGGNLGLYVNNSNGELTPDELARIQDAVNSVDTTIAPYGVSIAEVTNLTQANVTLSMGSNSPVGGYSQGILGCYTTTGAITLIQGWNWYAGADPTQIGADQYDFQTTVTHELGHALGLGESSNSTSAMYGTLTPGTTIRALTTADLNIPYDEGSADAQRAAVPQVAPLAGVTIGTSASSSAGMSAANSTSASSSGSPVSSTDQIFAEFAGILSAAWNAYQSELSSVTALRQTFDALAWQSLNALLSMEAGAMGMSKDTRIGDLLFADQSLLNGV